MGWDPRGDLSGIRELLAEAAARLTALDPGTVADRLLARRAAAQRPEPVAPLATVQAAERITADDRVRLRRHLIARLDHEVLRVGDTHRVDVTLAQIPAVESLLPGKPQRVGDLPCEDPVGLVARLMREGVVVLADDD